MISPFLRRPVRSYAEATSALPVTVSIAGVTCRCALGEAIPDADERAAIVDEILRDGKSTIGGGAAPFVTIRKAKAVS